MNDELCLTDEQLELATSRQLPVGRALDGDLAAVHTNFLALGQSLEQAGGSLDKQAILVGLQSRLDNDLTSAPSAIPATLVRMKSFKTVGWPSIALTLAAALLVALFVVPRADENNRRTQQPVADLESAITTDEVDESEPQTFVTWHEELDDEIALAAATLSQWSTSTRGVDASLSNMNDELSALSEELLGESL